MAEDVLTENGTITVRILNGAQFTSRNTRARTVGALRSELDLPASAEMSVNSITVTDPNHELQDDDIVAATLDNKNGGKFYLVPVN